MAVSLPENFNVFVGAKTGILKGICMFEGSDASLVQNIPKDLRTLSQEKEITAMAWGPEDETQVLMGLQNQSVQIYNTAKGRLKTIPAENGEGPIVGVAKFGEHLLTGTACGTVRLWDNPGKEINTGGPLERLRVKGNIVATGGKKNDLKLWDVNSGLTSTFKAKNVPHDWLELEVPVWISDIAFIPDSDKIIVSTRHGHVRIYDPKAQRRPVFNMEFKEKALTSIAVGPTDGFAIVGTAIGQVYKVDLRQKGMIAGHYKGVRGSVREVACVNNKVITVGLDRHIRVHDAESKQLIKSEYLKSKLNCLLVKSNFELYKKVEEHEVDDDEVEVKIEAGETEMDEIFGALESVNEPSKKNRKGIKIAGLNMPPTKKLKR
ncbi:WD repeat-containing protein 74 [Cloeon dipterum]|uniref:WD repeat-containing protein 74 n=1 Tax=Cloeon dipterum TaxID=197152 RepID=UPI003220668D